jgi:membrane-bound lytic murein transglycosylase MltF
MGDYEFVDKDDKQLLRVLMAFMDEFNENYTVLENIKSKNIDSISRFGYRTKKDKLRGTISYTLSGIQPSREEIERQVRSFIQMKNL